VTARAIQFFTEDTSFVLKDRKKLRNWIYASMDREKKVCGSINFIFCSDDYLHALNVQYLRHDTYTDIITFDSGEGNTVSGDIFISIDRVRENAKHFGVPVVNELHRVMIHGMLHLAGYGDKTGSQQASMRAKEDYYLSLQPEIFRK
jgi:rRNA maturation RNase YbeY